MLFGYQYSFYVLFGLVISTLWCMNELKAIWLPNISPIIMLDFSYQISLAPIIMQIFLELQLPNITPIINA